MLYGDYPNLELLEYKAKLAAQKFAPEKYDHLELQADMFIQTWGSTALGFGGMGGSAMTKAYTTVFQDVLKGVFIVFFDSQIAYIVTNPTERFFEDLRNRCMASVNKSKLLYEQ